MAIAADTSFGTTLARPWPRFWARFLDVQLYGVPIILILATIFPALFVGEAFQGRSGDMLAGVIALPFVMLLDAAILANTGSSPGKALAGLYFADADSGRVSLARTVGRNARVYFRGFILGLPLLVLVGYANAYNDIKDSGLTDWDRTTDTRVFANGGPAWRTWAVAILGIFVLAVQNALARAADPTY
jgi:uncharacterized RDD family membrane protein YckC